MNKVFVVFSLLFLVYMIWPGPGSINDFFPLPNSEKSTLSGDSWQIPNVAGYYSDNYRDFAVKYYLGMYRGLSHFFFPPIKINHPPEYAFTAIKQYTESTYLEELTYPLRDSLFVNGFEPYYQDGEPKFWGSSKFVPTNRPWDTKVTIRFYPSPVWARFVTWLGIIITMVFVYKLTRKIFA